VTVSVVSPVVYTCNHGRVMVYDQRAGCCCWYTWSSDVINRRQWRQSSSTSVCSRCSIPDRRRHETSCQHRITRSRWRRLFSDGARCLNVGYTKYRLIRTYRRPFTSAVRVRFGGSCWALPSPEKNWIWD